MIVMKFGGVSLESADAINRLVAIVASNLGRQPIVVVSAVGDTTDRLLAIADLAAHSDMELALNELQALQINHLDVLHNLFLGQHLKAISALVETRIYELEGVLAGIHDARALPPAMLDEVVSYGERLSSEIVAGVLNAYGTPSVHVDARSVVLTNDEHTRAKPVLPESYARIQQAVDKADGVVVLGGFIGSTPQGSSSTLGRGGSDLTAAIVGVAVNAEEIQFWKNVDGVLTCDPQVFNGVYRLKSISYAEAAEMSRCGAKVLHPDTVAPAASLNIPLLVCNSSRPANEGTRIVRWPEHCGQGVKSIACSTGITVCEIFSDGPDTQDNFPHNYFDEFCEAPPELVCSNGSAHYVASRSSKFIGSLEAELKSNANTFVHHDMAVISLIGDHISDFPGLPALALSVLDHFCLALSTEPSGTIRMIVPQVYLSRAVELLHTEFFKDPYPALFAELVPSLNETGSEVLV